MTTKEKVQKTLIEMGKLGELDGKNIPSIFRRAEFSNYLEFQSISVSEIAEIFVELN